MPFYIVSGAETLAGEVVAIAIAVGADPVVSLSESTARLARVKRCPHRGEKADCGCEGLRRCALGRGREGTVALPDCLACVAAEQR